MTEIQIPYLPTAQFFKIRCRLGINEQDIIGDSDSDPQIRTIGGTVTISASIPRFRYTEADGRKRVVYTKTETYNIQTSTGELFDADGNIGVNLLNTNSPQMDPQGWTYKATVRPNGGEPFDVPIPSDGGGEVFDLGDGLVFTPSTGITDLETRVKALEDSAGTVTPPGGGGGAVSSVAGRTGDVTLSVADLTDASSLATDTELTSGLAGKANSSHTHTSLSITDWAEAVQDTVAAMLTSGANVTLAYDDAAGKVTVTASGGDAELMRDTIGAALVGVGGISVAINDAANTITLSISGVSSTQISDFTEATQDVVGAMIAAAGGSYNDDEGIISLPSGGGGSDQWTYVVATADTTNNTNVAANVAGMSIPALDNGLYEFEVVVRYASDNGTNGAWIGLSAAPSGATVTAWGIGPSTNNTTVIVHFPNSLQQIEVQASSSAGNLTWAQIIRMGGTIRAASMSSAVHLTLRNESGGAVASVKADSFIRYRRIAN